MNRRDVCNWMASACSVMLFMVLISGCVPQDGNRPPPVNPPGPINPGTVLPIDQVFIQYILKNADICDSVAAQLEAGTITTTGDQGAAYAKAAGPVQDWLTKEYDRSMTAELQPVMPQIEPKDLPAYRKQAAAYWRAIGAKERKVIGR